MEIYGPLWTSDSSSEDEVGDVKGLASTVNLSVGLRTQCWEGVGLSWHPSTLQKTVRKGSQERESLEATAQPQLESLAALGKMEWLEGSKCFLSPMLHPPSEWLLLHADLIGWVSEQSKEGPHLLASSAMQKEHPGQDWWG